MCGVQLKDSRRSTDFMLGLNKGVDQLAMTNSVCWLWSCLEKGIVF